MIRAHGEGETVWPEIVRDRERILGAVAALRAARTRGPYR